jgi:hypothetical protein
VADLNEGFTDTDFAKQPKWAQEGFAVKPKPRVVRLDTGFQLYKITVCSTAANGEVQLSEWISPWWCAMKPYQEDTEGALGRYYDASDNDVDMSVMTRFMAAVRIDWNEMSHMLQVKLTRPVKGFWGKFAPQPKSSPLFAPSDAGKPAAALISKAKAEKSVAKGAQLPETLGSLDAWQFFIPNMKKDDIEPIKVCDAHDMRAVGRLVHDYWVED